MPHVLVAGRIHEDGIAVLKAAPGITMEVVDEVSLDSYLPHLDEADAVLIRTQPMPAHAIDRAGRLRIVSRHGVGYDAVDVSALNARSIPLTIVGDVNSVSVAEHTLMLMLSVAHATIPYDAATRASHWSRRNSFEASELHGKTVLVVGFGRIGRAVSKLCAAFGMRVAVYDPFIAPSAIETEGYAALSDLGAALPAVDVVTVHVPLVSGGAVIGEAELDLLKPGAIVVNTARGGIVDEAALVKALEAGRLRGAGLDVFATEPPKEDDPLLSCERTVLSPHSAGLTEECAARMAVSAARNIVDFFEGRLDRARVVNLEVLNSARSGVEAR